MTQPSSCQYDALVALSAVTRLDVLCRTYVEELGRWFPESEVRLYGYVDHHDYWRMLAARRRGDDCARLRHESLRELPQDERAARAELGVRLDNLFEQAGDEAVSGLQSLDGALAQTFRIGGQERMTAIIEPAAETAANTRYLLALGEMFRHQYLRIFSGLHDVLTGLLGRATFEEDVTRVLQRVTQDGAAAGVWGLALMDIDLFKSINDRFGHLFGDEVLVRLAQTMRRAFREDDRLFRYGGEEFAVLLHAPGAEALNRTLERFRKDVAAMEFSRLDRVTISIGYVVIDGSVHHVSALVDCADKALYYAKDHGRNQVCGYGELVESRAIEPIPVAESEIDLF